MPEPFKIIESRTVVMPSTDIDTDQIIPARFLTTTERLGLGQRLFQDTREPGGLAEVLGDPRCKHSSVLVAGDNFGCGSSREHAAWALHDFGFRAVISTSFADIFTGNALSNGVLPVVVPMDLHTELCANPWVSVHVDLQEQKLTVAGKKSVEFRVEPFARYCLLRGMDPLDFLLGHTDAISAFEGGRA